MTAVIGGFEVLNVGARNRTGVSASTVNALATEQSLWALPLLLML